MIILDISSRGKMVHVDGIKNISDRNSQASPFFCLSLIQHLIDGGIWVEHMIGQKQLKICTCLYAYKCIQVYLADMATVVAAYME